MAKRALCIGINDYPGTEMDLKGCVNDAEDWAAELSRRAYTVEKLVDAEATKAALVKGIRTLVQGANSGDSLAITFSGHGTYAPDTSGDESDGLDEALCPYDIKQGNALIDDEIHALFAERKPGVRILLISDSCHSGTVTRAAPPDPEAEGPRPRFMPMGSWLPDDQLPRAPSGKIASLVGLIGGLSPFLGAVSLGSGHDLLLSGCAEGPNNFSYDAKIAGRANGAFTYYALKALKRMSAMATYAEWHAEIRKSLPSANYAQTPQLFGSKKAFRNKLFV
jgi:hypothetical protein